MTTTSKRQQSAKLPIIRPGECGWGGDGGCENPNQPGVWSEGGSYMCVEHEPTITAIRDKIAEEEDPYGTRERAAEERGEEVAKPRRKRRPTCTVIGCDETRMPGETACALHQEDEDEDFE